MKDIEYLRKRLELAEELVTMLVGFEGCEGFDQEVYILIDQWENER